MARDGDREREGEKNENEEINMEYQRMMITIDRTYIKWVWKLYKPHTYYSYFIHIDDQCFKYSINWMKTKRFFDMHHFKESCCGLYCKFLNMFDLII